MKTTWDYTTLADAYLKRAAYSNEAIDRLLNLAGIQKGQAVCDVGAGVAHLTLMLADRGLKVAAVEPNDAMRAHGIARTKSYPLVQWYEGVGEATGQTAGAFRLVTFGSSFNVTDRPRALLEAARILAEGGWFACMWNHRDLSDPIQHAIEEIIRKHIPDYDYGTRREDQTEVITASNIFVNLEKFEAPVKHTQSINDCVESWQSHGTLQRQAGDKFGIIVSDIRAYLEALGQPTIDVPYTTRVWAASKR